MTSDHSGKQDETGDPFAYLYHYEFVQLITFRKSGAAVPTAMWFAHDQGKLYMVTSSTAGKIKRIRNNKRVLLASCDLMGNILGKQIEALAHELPSVLYAYANALLAVKYGVQYEMAASDETDEAEEETFIELVPVRE